MSRQVNKIEIDEKWRNATPKQLKRMWLSALRSGKYKKTRSTLARFSIKNDGKPVTKGFCCLGVLEHKILNGHVECHLDGVPIGFPSPRFYASIPGLEWVKKHDSRLSLLNDEKGWSLKRIADYIDKHWET